MSPTKDKITNGNWAKTQTVKNDYLYNGKELNTDLGLNWSDYGFRFYDAAIGRFTGVDPISDQFAYLSTYNYAGNSPIANIDLWGLQPVPFSVPFNDGNTIDMLPDYYEGQWIDFFEPVNEFVEEYVLDEIPVVGEAKAIIEGDPTGFAAGLLPGGKKIMQGVEKIADATKAAKVADNTKDAAKAWDGPVDYSDIVDHKSVGPGKNYTAAQKKKILQKNRDANGGVLKSDADGSILDQPVQSKKAVKANMNQAEVDHIQAKSKGGSNSSNNAQIISKKQNIKKSNN